MHELTHQTSWIAQSLSNFSGPIQENILRKMIEADNLKKDAMAQLVAAERFIEMGFSISDGNGKDSVFSVYQGADEPAWVVSASLSLFMGAEPFDGPSFVSRLLLAKSRLLKHCARKIPYGERFMLCINVNPSEFSLKAKDLDDILFGPEVTKVSVGPKGKHRLTGVLMSYGEPGQGIEWVFHRQESGLRFIR